MKNEEKMDFRHRLELNSITTLIGAVIGGLTAPLVITNLGWKVGYHFAKNGTQYQ